MSFIDELFTWGVILVLGYFAWITKIKPELERRKKENVKQTSTATEPIKIIDAEFKEKQ